MNENVLDIGTGGGFPGIPLAIIFPETKFHLVDSIQKKIRVVNEVANSLELKNVSVTNDRFEHIKSYYVDLTGTMALRAYTRQYIYFLAKNPALYKIIFQEMGHDSWRSIYLIEQLFTPVIWFGEKSIEAPLDSLKEFKTIPRANFISIIIGASSSFFMLAQLMENQYGTAVFSEEQIEQHAEVVNNIIFSQFEV